MCVASSSVVDAIGKHGKMLEIVENAMKIRTTSLLFNCCTFGSILRLNPYISQYLIAMGGFDKDIDRDNSAAVVETMCACVLVCVDVDSCMCPQHCEAEETYRSYSVDSRKSVHMSFFHTSFSLQSNDKH